MDKINYSEKEKLLIKIGEFLAMEVDEIENYEYAPKDLGCIIRIKMNNGETYLLSLI